MASSIKVIFSNECRMSYSGTKITSQQNVYRSSVFWAVNVTAIGIFNF